MKTLATMLTELMRADAVPMSDGWGQLHDRLLKIDQTLSEIYEPVKVPTTRGAHVHHGLSAGSIMASSKAMWTCRTCGTLRDQVGFGLAAPTCGCGRIMHLGAYSENTVAIEMPIVDHAVCSAVLAAEGKPYPKTCKVHGLMLKCPAPRMHNWVRIPSVDGTSEVCSGCGVRSDSPVQNPPVCDGHLDY